MFKMDGADFWQQSRGPFNLHAAALHQIDQQHQQHQQLPHQHQQHHEVLSLLQSHQELEQQQNQNQKQQHHQQQQQHHSLHHNLTHQQSHQHLLLEHHSQQQQQADAQTSHQPTQLQSINDHGDPFGAHTQELHNQHHHHLLFNAAAAAAAAAHLSGVVKSNEATQSQSSGTALNPHPITNDENVHGAPGSIVLNTIKCEHRQVLTKQELQLVNNTSNVILPVLHQSLNENSSHHSDEDDDNPNAFKTSSMLSKKTEGKLQQDFNAHSRQLEQQSLHQQIQQTTSSSEQQQEQTNRNSPLSTRTVRPSQAQSPQPSLTPSAGSSTPDIKLNNEKMVNEMQLQLSRSNSAAAISERTLEECWSTLQRLFMHKSAMQQIQQIPRVGLGSGVSGSGGPGSVNGCDTKPHQCQQCLKSFSSNHQLVQHIRVHTGEKPYKCSYCDRRFKQLSHVQQHTRLHTGERPYKCHMPDCGRAFIQLSNLQQHLRNHDAQVERAKNRPFHCNICGKGFATESSLRTHTSKELQLHLGVLQQHAALIGGPNATSCPMCHKLFLGADTLMEHMKLAHKEKPPVQNVSSPFSDNASAGTSACMQSSSQSNDAYLAKRRTANHPCPVCGKHYVNEGSLRKHLACHPETSQLTNTLRMWPCSVCQAVFTHENGLLTHMEHMRMDPKHQFAAQYVLSRAAAERRERDSLLAATLAASGSGTNGSSGCAAGGGLGPLLGDDTGGGSNSMCPSPSANSECSSNGRLSSSATSDQGSGIHCLSNNNNNNNNNNNSNANNNNNSTKLSQLTSQYGVPDAADVANRMSLMAAASAAAAAVAATAGSVSNSNVVGGGLSSPGCIDSTASVANNVAVQAAVVNLAAAMRLNQVTQGGDPMCGTVSSSLCGGGNGGSGSAAHQQQQHQHQLLQQTHAGHAHSQQQQQQQQQSSAGMQQQHQLQHQQQPQHNLPQHHIASSPTINVPMLQRSPTEANAASASAAMNAMRDSMMRSGMGISDPLASMQQSLENAHHQQQQHSLSNLGGGSANPQTPFAAATQQSGAQHQQVHHHQHSHNPGQSHHQHSHPHHHHLNQMQQPHSPETALRMHQHAEAILRSHTEAAFRLAAASVAASNGICANNSNQGSVCLDSSDANTKPSPTAPEPSASLCSESRANHTKLSQSVGAIKMESHPGHPQQQSHIGHADASMHLHQQQQQQQQQQQSTSAPMQQQQQQLAQKLSTSNNNETALHKETSPEIGGSSDSRPDVAQQSHFASDIGENLRLQEHALRLQNERSLNFLTAAQTVHAEHQQQNANNS